MLMLDLSTLEFLSDSLTNPCHFCGFLFEEKRLGFVCLQETIHGVIHHVGVYGLQNLISAQIHRRFAQQYWKQMLDISAEAV